MTGTPRVSVIMPSYNHASFVGKAIESVLAQSFEDFEFVITDDGSTDGTEEIIRAYTDRRIELEVFAANQGACEAVNRCIERSRGEYIAVISSDDYFLPEKLARQVAILDETPELAAVFGLATFVDNDGAAIPPERNPFAGIFLTEPANRFAWLRHFFLNGNALCHSTVMIRRRIYEELGTYDVALKQLPDLDMWIRVCARYPIQVLSEPLIAFRVLSGLGNASAPSPLTVRRAIWEHSRLLRHYRTMDEATLERAFGADIPQEVAERGLPMAIQLAMMAASRRPEPWLELFALETMEAAVMRGVPGVGPRDLHELSGDLDIFRVTALHETALRLGESIATANRLQEHVANVESERNNALTRLNELERLADQVANAQSERDEARAQIVELERERDSLNGLANAQAISQARQRADDQAFFQAQLRAEAIARKTQVQELQEILQDMQRSNSWRLTLPIRVARTYLRKKLQALKRQTDAGASVPRS